MKTINPCVIPRDLKKYKQKHAHTIIMTRFALGTDQII